MCHAGSGTTLAALAAQVPIVAVPLFADQPDNARRIAATECGVAVAPTAEDVARAVKELSTHTPHGCPRLGRELAALPDAAEGVPFLESLVQ